LKNVHEIYTIWETKNESEVSLVSKSEQKEKKEQEKRILVKRERHVRQLFIKGDTIVLVTKADSQDKFKT
jgi:small nuclear ribonucleoprotein (snRNP)-like protein